MQESGGLNLLKVKKVTGLLVKEIYNFDDNVQTRSFCMKLYEMKEDRMILNCRNITELSVEA